MRSLLFSPAGRLPRHRFWQALVVLTVASTLVVAGQVLLTSGFGLLGYALVYPYICVYGKRLHDTGRSAWWVVGVLLATLTVQFVVTLFLEPVFRSDEIDAVRNLVSERFQAGDLAGFMQQGERLNALLLPLNLINTILGNLVVGFFVGRLAADPYDNNHGPKP
jgi:hypothetical protein